MDQFDTHVDAYSKTTGRKQRVPRGWIGHPVLGADFALTPTAKARELATSSTDPSIEWTLPRLRDHARTNDVNITGLRSKRDILAAITAPQITTTNDPTPAPHHETPAVVGEEE